MLRYRADLRTLAIVATYYAVFAAAWMSSSGAPFYVVALCVMSFFVAVITHNTIHHPIFKHRFANRVFSVVLSWGFGSPASGFLPGHNLSHHRYLGTLKDNVRTHKMRFRWNFLNQLFFVIIMAPGILRTESRYAKAVAKYKVAQVWSRQHRFEVWFLNLTKLALFLIDWKKALLFVLIPNIYAVWAIFGVNFHQHDGCDETHPYNHTRSFTGSWLNYFSCNNGYHAVHHEKPALHWSLYPAYHAAHYHGRCHPNLEQKNLLVYLWRSCIYPGTRLSYDGTPIVDLRPAGKDEDWVADAFATQAAKEAYGTEDDTWLPQQQTVSDT